MSSDNPNKIIADANGTQATVKDFGDGDPRLGVHMLTSLSAHASTHRPDDSDGLAVGSPDDLAAGDSSVEGSANAFVRQDHQHGVPVVAPDDLAVGDTAAVGSSTNLVRSDHQHGVPAATPGNLSAGGSAAEGSGTSFVRNDHQHGAPTAAPDDLAVGDTAAEGVGTSFVRNDHQHGVPAAVPANLGAGDTAAAGSGTNFVRDDHQHGVPVGVPSSIGTTNAEGSSTDLVRKDHVHDGTHEVTSTFHTSTETNEDYFLKPDGSGGVEWGSIGDQKVGLLALKALAGTIAKGTPVYVYDYSSNYRVEEADADDSAKMPCVGLAYEQLDTSTAKRVIVSGVLTGVDTSSWSVNDILYVSTTAGQLTTTRPSTATSDIQPVATVLRSDASAGAFLVHSTGRVVDIPNFQKYTEETSPALNDLLLLADQSDSYAVNKVTIQNVLELVEATDLAMVSVTRTTSYTIPTAGTWGTPTFDTQLEENDTSVLEWTAVSSTRITGKEAGAYLLIAVVGLDATHTASFEAGVNIRFAKNGTGISTSEVEGGNHYSGSGVEFEGGMIANVYPITLAANDYIELQLQRTKDTAVGTVSGQTIRFAAIRLAGKTGSQGEQGPQGADGDITWEGAWSVSTTYNTNEAVFYGGSSWVCIATSTGDTPVSSPTYWEKMTAGFWVRGDWNGSTTYYEGDVVANNGHFWLCIYDPSHSGQEPPNATYWLQISRGFNWVGQWSSGAAYNIGDCVENDGASYYCILSHTNQEPPNATYWDILVSSVTFGNNFANSESLSESSYTGDFTFQEKLTLTTASIPAGNYIVNWSYEWSYSNNDSRCKFQVQVDDTTTIHYIQPETGGKYPDGVYLAQGGHAVVTLTSGTHDIDLDYGLEENNGHTVYIRRARLTMWRVS